MGDFSNEYSTLVAAIDFNSSEYLDLWPNVVPLVKYWDRYDYSKVEDQISSELEKKVEELNHYVEDTNKLLTIDLGKSYRDVDPYKILVNKMNLLVRILYGSTSL
jgi:hypothetical protein